jgi:hypothetical protein
MMSYNNYFDTSMGHEWKDAYEIVYVDVIRDKKWLSSDRRETISAECTEITIDYIDEVGGLCGGNIVCTTTDDDKCLIAIDSQNGAIVRRISIINERIPSKRTSTFKAIDETHILLLSPISNASLILLDASTFEIVQTFSISDSLQIPTIYLDSELTDENSLQICDCLMNAQYIVASVFLCSHDGEAVSGLYIVTWDRQSGDQSSMKLTDTTPQKYVMAINKGYIRLIIQNPLHFEVPWNIDRILEKGQWLIIVRITDFMEVIQHSLFNSHYDCMGILTFCSQGQYLVTGGERYGPLIYEDLNFNSDRDEVEFLCVFEDHDFGEVFPEMVAGNKDVILMLKNSWWQNDADESLLSVCKMEGLDRLKEHYIWGAQPRDDIVLNIDMNECFILAAFADIPRIEQDEQDDIEDGLESEPNDDRINKLRVWDLSKVCHDRIRMMIGETHNIGHTTRKSRGGKSRGGGGGKRGKKGDGGRGRTVNGGI